MLPRAWPYTSAASSRRADRGIGYSHARFFRLVAKKQQGFHRFPLARRAGGDLPAGAAARTRTTQRHVTTFRVTTIFMAE